MSPSVRMIIELNIKHAVKRRMVAQLLVEEETKLAKLIDPPKESEG
jgi:hypothetical protein